MYLSAGVLFLFILYTSVYTASIYDASRQRRAMRVPPTPYPIPHAPSLAKSMIDPFEFALAMMNSTPLDCPSSNPSIARPSQPRSMTPKMTLNDDHLQQILQMNGGYFDPRLMASTSQAADHFPNLIPLTENFENGDISDSQFDFQPEVDNFMTKTQIIQDLSTWSLAGVPSKVVHNTTNISNGVILSPTTNIVKNVTGSNRFNRSTMFLETLQQTSVVNAATTQSTNMNINSAINQSILKSKLEHAGKEIQTMLAGVTIHASDLTRLKSSLNITLPTRSLDTFNLHSGHGRVKRNADGSSSTINYCRKKGDLTNDGFMHMCGECAVTTEQSSDKFPRYLNEVVCNGADRTCFTVPQGPNGHGHTIPHGVCKQSFLYVKLIRRRPGGCRMMIHDGQNITVDAWETYNQKVRSGCECFFDQRSIFAPYIGSQGSQPIGK